MSPSGRKNVFFFLAVLVVVAFGVIFPRILSFAELAAREMRFFWWLIFLVAIILLLSSSRARNDREAEEQKRERQARLPEKRR